MMVTIRMYRQHDLDLITLYRHPNFSLPAAIKKALIAYVRKEQLIIKQPAPYQMEKEKISRIVQVHINLNEEYEKDIIDWIKDIKEGFRNSVLKNIIRGYIAGPFIYTYQKSESAIDDTDANNKLFEDNIKIITPLKSFKSSKPRKKKKKDDGKKIQDSILAKEILSDNKEKKKDVVFIERIDDDDVKVEIPTKVEKKPEPQESVSQEDMDDMWGDIDSMMDQF